MKALYHAIEGSLPKEGVPILLPAVRVSRKLVHFFPRILVYKKKDKELLIEIIKSTSPIWISECNNDYLRDYLKQLPKVEIVSFEEVEEHLKAGEFQWARLETIPIERKE